MSDSSLIQVIEPRIPHHVICPHCQQTQIFRKKKEHWRTLKTPHLNRRVLLKGRMISAKCRNPGCSYKSVALPIAGIERYQRATQPLISEALSIDEYMPRRGSRYEQIAGDAIQRRILYIKPAPSASQRINHDRTWLERGLWQRR